MRHVAGQRRGRWPKRGALMDEAEEDVLARMTVPGRHRVRLHSTNTFETLNKNWKRRADAGGILPNEDRIMRRIGAVLLEADDAWQLRHRHMQIEGMAEPDAPTDMPQPLIPGTEAA